MFIFLSCFPNKLISTTAQAALGGKYSLCHSYSESICVIMATMMEGGRDDRYIPFEKQAPQTQPEVEILNIFRAITGIYEIWRMLLM